jgi:catechol 2,3-dioxygenase-like lactoylglutathione lyase family enzyme
MSNRSSRRHFVGAVAGAALMSASSNGYAQTAAGGGIRGFDHVAVPLQNTEPMLAFYKSLGFQVTEAANAVQVYVGGNQMINFHRPARWQDPTFTLRAPAARPPCGDFCFVWDGTAESLRALLNRIGARVEIGPVERAGGRQRNGTSTYIRDPDGNLLEFMIY